MYQVCAGPEARTIPDELRTGIQDVRSPTHRLLILARPNVERHAFSDPLLRSESSMSQPWRYLREAIAQEHMCDVRQTESQVVDTKNLETVTKQSERYRSHREIHMQSKRRPSWYS